MAYTFVPRTLPAAKTWSAAVWNGSVFCVVSSDGFSAASPDGITWTLGSFPAGMQPIALATNGILFAVADFSFSSTKTATSPDGVNWTVRTLSVGASWRAIASNGSGFVITGNSNYAFKSVDGITWSLAVMPFGSTGWQALGSNGGVYCAGNFLDGTRVATSPNGGTWTIQALPASPASGILAGGISSNGTVFCALPDTSSSSSLFTSPDGVTWTYQNGVMPSGNTYSVNYQQIVSQAGRFYVGGTKLLTSLDGVSWTSQDYPGSVGGLAVSPSTILAVGYNSSNAFTASVALLPPPAFWTGNVLTSEVSA